MAERRIEITEAGRDSNVIPKAMLDAAQDDAATLTYRGESVTVHPRMSFRDFGIARRRIETLLLQVVVDRARNGVEDER